MDKIKFILIFLLCTAIHKLNAQQQLHTVKGIIIDSVTNQPVENAVVHSSVGNKFTTSSATGSFSIRVAINDTLIISYVGYENKKVAVNSSSGVIQIILQPVNNALTDVTIHTGYQQLKPNETTGSYVVIGNKMLNQQTGLNILQRLKGVTSSLQFTVGKSVQNPQSSLGITIRGLSTINGPLDPLIVVDNFIYDGDINNINPNDVESITVMKDAAATSIWGARAGNGVIVITTKKGKFNQKLQVDFNTDVILTNKPNLFYNDQISSSDYIDFEQFLFNKGYYTSQLNNRSRPVISPAVLIFQEKQNGLISAEDSAEQINALKQNDSRKQFTKYYYKEGVTQQYALNLHGGSSNLAWMVSGTYDKDINNLRAAYNKINLRFENTYRPLKNMTINAGVYYSNSNNITGLPSYNTLISLGGSKQVPYVELVGAGGTSIAVPYTYNSNYIDTAGAGMLLDWHYYPLEDYKHHYSKANTQELLGHIGIDYSLVKGIDINLLYQYQKQNIITSGVSDTASFTARNTINTFTQLNRATGQVTYIVPLGGILSKSYSDLNSYNFRGQLNIYKNIGSLHKINAIAGMEVRDEWTSVNSAIYYGYNADPLTYTGNMDYVNRYPTFITGGLGVISGGNALYSTESRFVSLFSNASYTYDGKYILSGSVRRDGSNIFGVKTNDRWKPLWSAGVGWELSKENFYHIAWMPFLKLSATYGVSGNVDLTKTALPVAGKGTDNNTGLPDERINSINNPDLSWEHAYQMNLKLDFSTANNTINGTLEYYHKKGTDLYAPVPYDYTTWGLSSTIVANAADMKGNGIDITLHSNNLKRTVKWSTDFLFSYNTSITTKYYTSTATTVATLIGHGNIITPIIGKPLYALAAYKWGGLDGQGNPRGYLNDTLSENYTAIQQSAYNDGAKGRSFTYVGPSEPAYFGSIMNDFMFKGFELSLNIAYKFHYFLFKPALSYSGLASQGIAVDYNKRWQNPGDENKTNVPSFVYPLNPARDGFYGFSEVNVIKGDHIRLQFVNLSYSFLHDNKKLPFKGLQVYINAENIGILWRANKDNIDPDYINIIPDPKTYTIGIRANF